MAKNKYVTRRVAYIMILVVLFASIRFDAAAGEVYESMPLIATGTDMAVYEPIIAYEPLLATISDMVYEPAAVYESPLATGSDMVMALTLPEKLPFAMILPRNGLGFIHSDDFLIKNTGDSAVLITIDNARVNIANPYDFAVISGKDLPENKSSLSMYLVFTQNGHSKRFSLTLEPQTLNTFSLESGETAYIRFGGAIREHSDTSWENTAVTVSVTFAPYMPRIQE